MGAHEPEDLHQEFGNAFNAGNLNAVMALYEASGHQANRETLQQFIGLKGLIEMAHW